MDRKIEKSRLRPWISVALIAMAISAGGYLLYQGYQSGRSVHIDGQRLSVARVESGTFEDFIPIRGRIAPLKTVFLDAVQGGRVEEILLEDGALVQAGQPIVRLSNSDLQLSVMSTESRVIEQLNSMRDQELRLEQNRLNHKRSLIDIEYDIRRLTRDLKRQEELFAKGHISESEHENFVDQLNYLRESRDLRLESQSSDKRLMESQLSFFQDKASAMEQNLAFARKSLDELNVRAPVTGKLSGFDLEIGQNLVRGNRIGQIDDPNSFKLIADIDEFYLPRVDLDQPVSLTQGREEFRLRVSKVYPNVRNGQFEIDMQFIDSAPANIRRGQTIQAKLTLGDANQALLIPNGPFMQDSGGKWLFVLNSEGTEAVRREVQLGRRNHKFIEVLSGLNAGEQIIYSSYSAFEDMDRIFLDSK